MWDFLVAWCVEYFVLAIFLGVGGFILTCALLVGKISGSRKSGGVICALVGVGGLLVFYNIITVWEGVWLALALLAYGGGISLLIGFLFAIARGIGGWIWKAKQKKKTKSVQYLLPKQGNEYVRSRLQTALKVGREEVCQAQAGQSAGEIRVPKARLAYARGLLARVRGKNLSMVDGMKAEELGRVFFLYENKEGVKAKDVNEGLNCLLKLASKYSVEP